ncbi:hypothetical protein E3N88_05130 [Mikania micrantha]|uniref:Uncharacterized protein n=1 Tax=Mikania micrantha TaxID=192012 RepID=A0A5N6PWW4_9ASTR|nr:hypothetical protein E3N88_05130 [Mikania micrantha]
MRGGVHLWTGWWSGCSTMLREIPDVGTFDDVSPPLHQHPSTMRVAVHLLHLMHVPEASNGDPSRERESAVPERGRVRVLGVAGSFGDGYYREKIERVGQGRYKHQAALDVIGWNCWNYAMNWIYLHAQGTIRWNVERVECCASPSNSVMAH